MATTLITILLSLFFICSVCSAMLSSDVCDTACYCSEINVDCKGANLDIIPTIPSRVIVLDLSRNNIRSITTIPALVALRHLNLTHNHLSHIEATSFQRLNSLETLDLSHNSLTALHPGLFSGLNNLKHVNLSHNFLPSEEIWPRASSFRKLDIETLDLSSNKLTKLSRDLIGFFNSVKTLKLSRNRFSYLDSAPIQEFLKTLVRSKYEVSFYIDENEVELKFDDFFFQGLQLKTLNLRGSHITDLKFMDEVVALNVDLSDNPLYIKTLKLNNHMGRACEKLFLSNVGLQTRDIGFLSVFTNLRVLDLSRNHLYLLDGRATMRMTFLQSLDLSQNSDLSELSLDFWQSLTTLERLNLSGCAFERIDPLITSELGSLSVLDLSHNNFQTLPDSFSNIFETVRSMNMSSNPIHCNCEMMWFINWTRTEKFLRSNIMINDFICASPVKRPLKDMTLMDFKCREPTIFNMTRNITHPEGTNDVMFYCGAEADPPPTITWTSPFGSKQSNTPSANRTRYAMFSYMKLSSLKKIEHEGWYECVAENQLGRSVGRTYLKVLQPKVEILVSLGKENSTTSYVSTSLKTTNAEKETKLVTSTPIVNNIENFTSEFISTSNIFISSEPDVTINISKPSITAFVPVISITTEPTTLTTSTATTTTTTTTTPTTSSTTPTSATFKPIVIISSTKAEPTSTTLRDLLASTPSTFRASSTSSTLKTTYSPPFVSVSTSPKSKIFEPMSTSGVVTSEHTTVPRNMTDEVFENFMSSFENRVAIFVAVGILCLLATLLIMVLAIVLMRKRHRQRKYLLDKKNTFLRTYSTNGSQPRRHRSNSGVMTTPLNSTLERPRNGFDILLAKEKGLS